MKVKHGDNMNLNDWRLKQDLSHENLARLLNLTTSKVYRICTKTDNNCIKLIDANKIVSITGGEVSYEDMLSEMGDC